MSEDQEDYSEMSTNELECSEYMRDANWRLFPGVVLLVTALVVIAVALLLVLAWWGS